MIKLLYIASLALLLTNCGNMESNTQSFSSESIDCTNCSAVHLAVDLNSKTEVLSQTKTLQSFRSCLGLEKIDTETMTQYNSIKGSLSYSGKSNSVNNTVAFANTKAAAIVCKAFIDQEEKTGNRKIFADFYLSEDDQFRRSNMASAIKKIAQNCWGRKIAQTELETIENKVTSIFKNESTSRASAQFICTAMLSTPEAMKQ